MPSYQGLEFLERVFDALAAQRVAFAWEMIVVDSGSSDGTWEFLKDRVATFPVPLRLERIHGVEFDHGDTRNLLASRSTAEFLVFLTQDAIPADDTWLARLLANFEDEEVGAVTCRNVPRPDADLLTKIFSEGDPGYATERREQRLPERAVYDAMNPHERRLLYSFNDVASAFRRSLWERHPFPRTPFGEDILMARGFLEAGYTVVYEADACVEHSHDYDVDETLARTRIDGRFNAEWLGRICIGSRKDASILTERLSDQDGPKIDLAAGELGLGTADVTALKKRARELRHAAFMGLWEGGKDAELNSRFTTQMRAEASLRILYVVHGFPPDTWAGTEIYTYNIAKEMARLGHEVAILTRAPAEGDEPEFSLREEEFQGLRVFRMTHRLDHASLRESYLKAGPEQVFRKIVGEFKPDVVHFQHLIHLSAGLVEIARDRGLATVVTCHDYWGLCSRVQMIRPDGAICASNMGSGCYLCVKERALGQVERVAKLDRVGGGRVLETLAGILSGGKGKAAAKADDYDQLRAREEIVPKAYAAADLRISPSRFLRDIYLASEAFDPHTFLFSDNGMRTDHVEALSPQPDAGGKVRFGFVGSLVWYKGGAVLVRAMRRLAEAGLSDRVHLNVYGGFDPEKDEHHAELAALAEGAPVTFHGRFDNSRLSEVYAEIDVLIVPSVWYENSPITIHEAFLTETPVLASAIGGMAEFVRDEVDGLHFEVGSDEDLARQMRRLAEEPDLLPRLCSADWMAVKTIEQNGQEMQARYRGLASMVRPARAGSELLFEGLAKEAQSTSGSAEFQGPDALLLRPGGSVQFDVGSVHPGRLRIEVDVYYLEGEPDLPLGATIDLGGGLKVEIDALSSREAAALGDESQPGKSPKCAVGAQTRTFYVTSEAMTRTIVVNSGTLAPSTDSTPLNFRLTRLALYLERPTAESDR